MSDSSKKLVRDFYQRSIEEQADFLAVTWCNTCMKEDLGMVNPEEYESNGIVYIEGACVKCGSKTITEIHEEDES
jgi:Fe-S cluster biogenesis protein NfuA